MTKPQAAPSPLKLLPVLTLGLICVSLGSILVRLAQEAPSLSIAFYRMLWASVVLSPFYWSRRPAFRISSWPLQLMVGLALALHFAFWIASLRYTTVAVSVLLVNTSPALVAILSLVVFEERLTRRGVAGLICSFIGVLILLWNDLFQVGDWRGAILALLGAVMLAVYLVIGRRFRSGTSLIGYVYPTYLVATLILAVLVWVSGTPVRGFSPGTHLFLILLGLLPQSIGHTSYNWALRFLSATVVSTLIMAEPVLATLLAWWIFGETVGPLVLVGASIVGAGIFTVSRWGIREPV